MSYGHADKIAARVACAQAAGREKPAPPINPALYRRGDVRLILAERDIGALYRLLKDEGVTQRRIAELTRQSPSEVSEILKGRRVRDVTVLERIAEGLGIPRELAGVSRKWALKRCPSRTVSSSGRPSTSVEGSGCRAAVTRSSNPARPIAARPRCAARGTRS